MKTIVLIAISGLYVFALYAQKTVKNLSEIRLTDTKDLPEVQINEVKTYHARKDRREFNCEFYEYVAQAEQQILSNDKAITVLKLQLPQKNQSSSKSIDRDMRFISSLYEVN